MWQEAISERSSHAITNRERCAVTFSNLHFSMLKRKESCCQKSAGLARTCQVFALRSKCDLGKRFRHAKWRHPTAACCAKPVHFLAAYRKKPEAEGNAQLKVDRVAGGEVLYVCLSRFDQGGTACQGDAKYDGRSFRTLQCCASGDWPQLLLRSLDGSRRFYALRHWLSDQNQYDGGRYRIRQPAFLPAKADRIVVGACRLPFERSLVWESHSSFSVEGVRILQGERVDRAAELWLSRVEILSHLLCIAMRGGLRRFLVRRKISRRMI